MREASVVERGHRVSYRVERSGGQAKETADLLEHEPFRSLALSLRLIYQKKEPANLDHICDILFTNDVPDDLKEQTSKIRKRFRYVLDEPTVRFKTWVNGEPVEYLPRDVFEHWMYGGIFHLDPDRRPHYEQLLKLGLYFEYFVQAICLMLAGRVLDLDDVVADFLGEPQLPRLE